MKPSSIQKNELPDSEFDKLKKNSKTYKYVDLSYVKDNLDSIDFYLSKFKNFPYRSFCTFDKYIQFVSDEGIKKISGIFGYPFSSKIELDNDLIKKCVDIELWFDYDLVAKDPFKLFKKLRKLTIQSHALGVPVRAVTELKDIGLERTNQWLEVCNAAGVSQIQTGYGLTSLNEDWIPEIKKKVGKKFKIKAVGSINSIQKAKKLLDNGADIIGSSTI